MEGTGPWAAVAFLLEGGIDLFEELAHVEGTDLVGAFEDVVGLGDIGLWVGIDPLGGLDHVVDIVLVGDEVLEVDAALVGIAQGEGSYPGHQIVVVGHYTVAGGPWVVVLAP